MHVHSTFSDGALAPADLIAKAVECGLQALAITDHDTTEGVREALTIKGNAPLEIVPGIEISCREGSSEFHLLGYFIDIDNPYLQRYVRFCEGARLQRIQRIVGQLNGLNIPITEQQVLDQSGGGIAGRLHVAQVLVAEGYARTVKGAFNHYLGESAPAFSGKWEFAVADAIKLIKLSGGAAVLAHPGKMVSSKRLYMMIRAGLDGIEVVHPSHNRRMQQHYSSLAARYRLLTTGGSDFHGNRAFDESNFGRLTVPYQSVVQLQEAAKKE